MKVWQIIAAGVVAAAAIDAVALLPDVPPTRAELLAFFVTSWPAAAVAWLSCYGVAVAGLATVVFIVETARARRRVAAADIGDDRQFLATYALPPDARPPREALRPDRAVRYVRRRWLRRYLYRLAATQYFTAVLALLVLGVPVKATWLAALPPGLGQAPALAACGILAGVGVLGILLAAVAGVLPLGRLVARLTRESRELRLLREIAAAMRERPMGTAPEGPQLTDLIEQSQRPVLEAVKELATSINRLGRGLRQTLHEIAERLPADVPAQGASTAMSRGEIEAASIELRALLSSFGGWVTKLTGWAETLAANDGTTTPPLYPAVRSEPLLRLSAELQELLLEMDETSSG